MAEGTTPTIEELAAQVSDLTDQVIALQAIVGETDYELRYSGEELDEICDKVCSISASSDQINTMIANYRSPKYGRINIRPNLSAGAGSTIKNVLSDYTNPIVFLSVEGDPHNFSASWKRSGNDLVISITPLDPQGLSTSKTYTVDYMILEG